MVRQVLRLAARFWGTTALIAVAAGAIAVSTAPVAQAQTYPTKPVKLVVPFPPGGSLDMAGRLIAQKLTESWGQSVVVENKPGAGGNIGADQVAKSPADGYTILLGALSTHAVNPDLYKTMPYDAARDFAPITLIAVTPNVLVVIAASPVNNVRSSSRTPRRIPASSRSDRAATAAPASRRRALQGRDEHRLVHIPFKGGAPATQALLAGDTQFMFDNLANAMAQVKAAS